MMLMPSTFIDYACRSGPMFRASVFCLSNSFLVLMYIAFERHVLIQGTCQLIESVSLLYTFAIVFSAVRLRIVLSMVFRLLPGRNFVYVIHGVECLD